MLSRFSRRAVLALTGGGVAGLATAAHAQGADRAEPIMRQAEILSYQPLLPPSRGDRSGLSLPGGDGSGLSLPGGDSSRLSIAEAGGNLALVQATVPKLIYQNQQLIVTVLAAVQPSMVGKNYVIRIFMVEDSGSVVSGINVPQAPIKDSAFLVQATAGGGHPIDDWFLTEERLYLVRASMNVVDQEGFAFSPDFHFKVRRVV
jgi:hypothetical protein